MTDIVDIQPGKDIKALVRELKATPERLDKSMRAEFRELAKEGRDDGRARAMAARPQPNPEQPRRREPTYHWKNLVNAITSGADAIGPFLKYGSDRVPGWAGHEWGSDRYPQFQPRTPKIGRGNAGTFFSPAVREMIPQASMRVEEIALRYAEQVFGTI